jgi:hypothetical protein
MAYINPTSIIDKKKRHEGRKEKRERNTETTLRD